MSRSGICLDNSAIESFLKSRKTECGDGNMYRTRAGANMLDYIEWFSNSRRRRSTIDYVSPIQLE